MSDKINPKELIETAEQQLASAFKRVDDIALSNQKRVLKAFRNHRLSEEFFVEKTGYGRNDPARETIDRIFAEVFGSEACAVRMQFVSGTHALACALLGNLNRGEQMASLTGEPYDTLQAVIGITGKESGSLRSMGVSYVQGDIISRLDNDQKLKAALADLVKVPTRLAYIQKSCGYTFGQKALSNQQIEKIASIVHQLNPQCIVMVDNCYGEFVEDHEPTAVGVDLLAGSLIKNPGGGLALTGGYIAGKQGLVEAALNRLTAPGIGGHMGLTYNQNRLLLQGLFLAPSVVANAVKGAMLFAHVFEKLGFEVKPRSNEPRYDIIQAIKLGSPERLISFCRGIQSISPVNAHVLPEPAEMPGYPDAVVMAGGSFIEGSTIELSADGPLRPPYVAFLQGGLTYLHVKCALEELLLMTGAEESNFIRI